ncbi:PAS fold family [Verrucomicrobiia bacterium DG1235]|nr:PAS fold family [Verrucomicrobiae bacterium DG1235]
MSRSESDRDGELVPSARSNSALGKATASALLETLDDHAIVAVTNPRGIITYVNDQFCAISQYSREELMGKTHRVVNSGYHPEVFWKKVWADISSGATWKGQICNRAKFGGLYWLQTTIHPVLDERGEIEQYVAFRTDITEQKQVENKLRNSQMHLQETARLAKVGSWEWDLIDQKLSWSWMTKVIHEVGPDYEPDLDSAIAFYPEGEMRNRINSLVERTTRTGEPFDDELQIRTQEGRLKWVRTIGQAEMVDSQCVRVFGVFQDIDDDRRMREQSERNSALLRSLVDSVTEFSVIATDDDGVITLFNAGAEKLLGYEASEVVGLKKAAIFHMESEVEARSVELSKELGEDVSGFQTFVAKSLREGAEQREWTYIRKDGERIPVILVVTPMRGDTGVKSGFLGIARDISARKRAENDLRESESRFRRSFEYSGIGMAIVSLEGKWIQVNQALLDMLEYKREELLELSFQEITHPDDLDADLALLKETLDGKRQSYALEKRYFDSKGKIKWVNLNVSLVRDWKGEPVHFVSQIQDVTERHLLDEDLKQARERLLLATEAGKIGIWDWDAATDTLLWDDQMLRLFGYEKEEFKTPFDAWYNGVHPDDFPELEKKRLAAIAGETQYDEEFRIVLPSGEIRTLKTLAIVQMDEFGKAKRMVGINWDVTEAVVQREELARLAAEADDANRAKSQFLANMSHEIRTPINGVIGMTSLLLDSPGLNSEQSKQARVIQSSGEALLALINDILDFSKVEAGKLDLEILDFDLRDTLDDLSLLLGQRAGEKQLEFICKADNQVPDRLRGDPGRLRQILINLAGNAIKFTANGSVKVLVSLADRDEKTALLRFSVIDTGIGISEEKKRLLFSEFTQADSSTTRLYGGTGLGLAISKQLVNLMDGEIGVTSEKGSGSEFWFTARLPYEESEYKNEQRHYLSGKSALLVVRRDGQRLDLEERLNEWNIESASCSLASAGLSLLRERAAMARKVDFLLFDPESSDLDVASFLEEVRGIEGLGSVKTIVLGGPELDAKLDGSERLDSPYRRSELYNILVEGTEPVRKSEYVFEDFAAEHFKDRAARILVAEDNIVNQMVVRGILEKFGLHADTVANGFEALEALRRIPYDLVLMDVQMPELDGLEASRRIRDGEAGEKMKDVPIVALTAHARTEDREICLNAGMDEYTSKPVAPRVLFRILDRMLSDSVHGHGSPENGSGGSDASVSNTVFDRAQFISGMMDDEDLAREIATLSLMDFQKHRDNLERVFATGSVEELLRSTHSIKGVSAHSCCGELNKIAARLERKTREGDEKSVRACYAEFSKTMDEGMAALKRFLED